MEYSVLKEKMKDDEFACFDEAPPSSFLPNLRHLPALFSLG
jgi:hypothetical protein